MCAKLRRPNERRNAFVPSIMSQFCSGVFTVSKFVYCASPIGLSVYVLSLKKFLLTNLINNKDIEIYSHVTLCILPCIYRKPASLQALAPFLCKIEVPVSNLPLVICYPDICLAVLVSAQLWDITLNRPHLTS